MSNINEVNAAVEAEKQDIIVLDDSQNNGIKFLLGEFEKGLYAGLKYTYPQITDLEKAIAYFTKTDDKGTVITDGRQVIMDKLNGGIKTTIATKTKNTKFNDTGDETKDKAEVEKLKALNPDGVVFTLKEAQAWRLGERESGLADMLDEARKELMSVLLGGNMPEQSLIARIAELQARIDARKRK